MNQHIATHQHEKTSVPGRREMLETFAQLAEKFQNARGNVQQRESQVLEGLGDLDRQLKAAGKEKSHLLSGQQPVTQAFRQWMDELNTMRQRWLQRVESYERGTEFRAKVGDSFLVYVYGKVNAGKSSLGNYIATGHHEPSREQVAQCHRDGLRFGWQEASHAQVRIEEGSLEAGFGVDRQECTRDIQFFTLPGLTWVDSPGLHSKTPENGELARRYAESADLVVYVMSAANPGRETDMQEIRALLALGKPMVFVITRADTIESDEIDGEIVRQRVMMSAAERQQQIKYVRQTLHEKLDEEDARRALAHADIATLSVVYAEEADDSQSLGESGIPDFMAQMQRLVAAESVTMKLETPQRNLEAFCVDLRASSERLSTSQADLQKSLTVLDTSVGDVRQRLYSSLHNELRRILVDAMQTTYQEPRQLAKQIREALQPSITVSIEQALQDQLERLDQDVAAALDFSDASHLPGFEERYTEYRYSTEATARVGGGVGGSVLGMGIGFLLGGPLGMAAGGILGAAAGERAGAALADTKTARVLSGDNRDEIEEAAIDIFSQDIEQAIDTHYVQPIRRSTQVVQKTLEETLQALERFRKTL